MYPTIGSGIALVQYSFPFYRFIEGLYVGASSVAAFTYVLSISNADNLELFGGLCTSLISSVMSLWYIISNYLLEGFGGDDGDKSCAYRSLYTHGIGGFLGLNSPR
ncbi:MAG: hypothetical protein ABI045_04340 [Flavobacteriales bacterium]